MRKMIEKTIFKKMFDFGILECIISIFSFNSTEKLDWIN